MVQQRKQWIIRKSMTTYIFIISYNTGIPCSSNAAEIALPQDVLLQNFARPSREDDSDEENVSKVGKLSKCECVT